MALVLGQRRGNRTTSSVATTGGTQGVAYTTNALNQYTQRTVPASATVTGLAPASATVTVNGSTASRVGDYFYASAGAANTGAPQWLTTTAATPRSAAAMDRTMRSSMAFAGSGGSTGASSRASRSGDMVLFLPDGRLGRQRP